MVPPVAKTTTWGLAAWAMATADMADSTTPANQRRVMEEDEEVMFMKKVSG
jgi:hypothetical protein